MYYKACEYSAYVNRNRICKEQINDAYLEALSATKYQVLTGYNGAEANYADLLKGELYGFGFDPTESELLLYNANKSVDPVQRLEMSFYKL